MNKILDIRRILINIVCTFIILLYTIVPILRQVRYSLENEVTMYTNQYFHNNKKTIPNQILFTRFSRQLRRV